MENKMVQVHRWRTVEERKAIVREYRQGGKTQREFAQEAGISLATLTKWLREERCQSEPGKLIEVALPTMNVVSVDIRAAGDVCVKVPLGCPVAWVGELVKALRCGA